MSEMQPWIGICHLVKESGEISESFGTHAAVWCEDREGFDIRLKAHLEIRGLQLQWSEEVLPAAEWMQRHAEERDVIALAPKVHNGHLVEMSAPRTVAAGTVKTDQSYLIIEEIEGVKPLDLQMGVHPCKTVPDMLYEPLFGQPDPTVAEVAKYGNADSVPPMKTYAILDAAKVNYLTMYLEDSGLPHRCLFKGAAAQELQDGAPYLVELVDENSFTRNLFTSAGMPSNMWDKEPGIYIRSRATLEELWKHFRKFTKVKNKEGKWFYFRFWDSFSFSVYLSHIADQQAPVTALFQASSALIFAVVMPRPTASGWSCIHAKCLHLGHAPKDKTNFILTNADIAALGKANLERDILRMVTRLKQVFPDQVASRAHPDLYDFINQIIIQMRHYEIRQMDSLFIISAWEICFGPNFIIADTQLEDILKASESEPFKMQALQARMAQLPASVFQSKSTSKGQS